ncbi:MAG: tetratricopeptide repeat protein [Chloroflexi bacterium]|nr:tetratricopeptide repeat protein [Chloroflexota bacterium]OJV91251.1 MAG: hypothetical protein BGO39_26745 [Chloroflexi bacterium 54-19]
MKNNNLFRRSNKPLISSKLRLKAIDSLWVDAPGARPVHQPKTTLPNYLTPFIGRQSEIETVARLLTNPDIHLVTLTGAAGTGKTRLALTVAENLANWFEDGVYFVNLAPLNKPEAGLNAIVQALGLQDHSRLSSLHKLQTFLQRRRVLLVLDNFEQILGLGPAIADLLMAAPCLKILVTSRIVLHLYGENVYAVPTLQIPVLAENSTFETVSQNEAVRLFVQYARMVNAEFSLTEANYKLIAALCVHLEGLPLSIELAAARCDVFPLQTLLDRLSTGQRFALLNSGFSNLPLRQQTLGEAIEWSYQLLSEPEKQLFRKLGVFVGSCSLAAAEAMNSNHYDTLDSVESLLNKSLLKPVEEAPGEGLRFNMLETIREFALAKLVEAGELPAARVAYKDYFIQLVETATEHLKDPDYLDWVKRLETDHPNILDVLDYLIENGEVEEAYHLGGDIWVTWWRWGYLNQGRQWLSKILALTQPDLRPVLLAKVLDGAAYLAMYQDDCQEATTYFEQSIKIWRNYAPGKFLARAISGLAGSYRILGNYEPALQLNYESLDLYHSLGEAVSEANSLCNIGSQLLDRGRYDTVQELLEKSLEMHTNARYLTGMGRTKLYLGDFLWRKNDPAAGIRQLEEGLDILRQVNHRIQFSNALNRLGLIYLWQGQTGKAEKLLIESIEISEELNKKQDMSYAYANLGLLRVVQNRLEEAENLFNQSIALRSELGQLEGVLWAMEGLAVVAIKQGDYARAQALLVETRHLRKFIEAPVLPHTLKFIIPVLLNYKELVDMTKNQPLPANNNPVAVKPVALPEASRLSYPTSYNAEAQAAALSKRETEVLHLVSLGHPTSQIAKLLVISPGTVNNHLNSIYSKLGVNSRTSAVRFALDNGII